MIRRAVILAPEARDDLVKLYNRIAEAAAPATALSYLARIEAYLMGFETHRSAAAAVTTSGPVSGRSVSSGV